MAAEALIATLLYKLRSIIQERFDLIVGVGEQRQELLSKFGMIQAVLEDAELNPPDSPVDQRWLINLKNAMLDIEDILYAYETHFSMPEESKCPSFMNRTPLRYKIARRMKAATRRLDLISREHEDYSRTYSHRSQPSNADAGGRQMGPILSTTEPVIGREDEKEMIVDILVNQVKDNQSISTLPIIGVGGLGKTTFAQLVFNDPSIVEHFEKRIWVSVPHNCDVEVWIKYIIISGGGSAYAGENLDNLLCLLRELLIGKKYLLVLDDVWIEDPNQWFVLKSVLSDGAPGSSIIVTTRLGTVSQIMGTLPSHNLKGLTEEQCWMLLKRHAFGSDEEAQYAYLEDIGRQIAKKCAGVPLAAKALGQHLQDKKTKKEWMHVKESELWKLPRLPILSVLKLSYLRLPLSLRQCFAYCAIFPKNSHIEKNDLIFRWMAHGYISSMGGLEVEEVGEKIWKQLIAKSLFQNVVNNFGEILMTTVTMHNLVHDLAQSIMDTQLEGESNWKILHLEGESNWKIREVNLRKGYVNFLKSTQTQMDISSISRKYNRLRVLDVAHLRKMRGLSSILGSFQHLRLLNLSCSYELQTLPDSTCNLTTLQVLNLNGCSKLERICKKPVHWKRLRHLFLEDCNKLCEMPSNIGESTSLKTLSQFIVHSSNGNEFQELEHLNQLEGRLEIRHLDKVRNSTNARAAKLSEKQNLHELVLHWGLSSSSRSREDKDKEVLEALQPHSYIKHFSIYGFRGRHFPTWMKMSTMTKVQLEKCSNVMNLSPLEEMPHLKSLCLWKLEVKYICQGGNETSIYFQALEKLELYELPNLKGLLKVEGFRVKGDQNMCPQLQELTVSECSALVLPPLTSLQKLIWRNNLFPSELLKHITDLKILDIRNLDEQTLPMSCLRHNTTLEEIKIAYCDELFEISGEVKHLQSLKRFTLCHLPKVEHVPEVIRHLPSLKDLQLLSLNNLTLLPEWLGNLTSLSMSIQHCPKLASLPDSIQQMAKLQALIIDGCPDLQRGCEKNTGEEKIKIAHIPSLKLKK